VALEGLYEDHRGGPRMTMDDNQNDRSEVESQAILVEG